MNCHLCDDEYTSGKKAILFARALLLLIIFVATEVTAQDLRIFYQYKYVPDTTKPADQKTAIMCLDLLKDHSEYFSYLKFKKDSVMKKGPVPDTEDWVILEKPDDFLYRIIKYQDHVLFKYHGLGNVAVEDQRKMSWDILPKHDSIEGYLVQKATTEFAGRKWTAWFTSKIPIPDGPYKFRGLPGLIIKIEDQRHQHSFVLNGIQKLSKTYAYPQLGGEEKHISLTEFKKRWLSYRKDPGAQIRQLYIQGRIPAQKNDEGNYVSGLEITRQTERRLRREVQADNNPIELDLFE